MRRGTLPRLDRAGIFPNQSFHLPGANDYRRHSAVVMGVNHPQMTGKFMDEVVDVPGKKSMTSVETDADFGGD